MLSERWPEFLRCVAEFKALSDSLSPEADSARRAIGDMAREFTAYTLSEWGVRRWEDILDIAGKEADDLDGRRFRVLTRIIEQPPVTKRTLYNQLLALAGEGGFKLSIDYGAHMLEVKLDLGSKSAFGDVEALLGRVAPADMVLAVTLLYNTHAVLAGFTHAQLAANTHEQLRNEVIV